MTHTTGKQAFLEILRQEGVTCIFGNPGTTELPLMDALVREPSLRYILALHESVAVGMADGFAAASGGLAVVNVHIAPGLANSLGMLYNAQRAGAPILVTAGQHDQSFTATEPVVWADLPPIAQPFVKWAGEVRRPQDLPRLARRAAKTALAHPGGPVFLSLPVDVLSSVGDFDLQGPTRVAPRIVGDRAAVDEAARLLAAAERPLIVAGDLVARSDALAELVELAELVGCPVMNDCMASSCSFPFTHPQYAGSMTRLSPEIRALLGRHDLLFAVGADLFTLSLPDPVDPMPPGLTVVHLDLDPWELGKNYRDSVAIHGDPKATLPELAEAFRRRTSTQGRPDAARRSEETRDAYRRTVQQLSARANREASSAPMSALSLVHALAQCAPPTAVIVEETLSSVAGIRQFFPCADSRALFGMKGGGIGWGIPAALGVRLALPHRPVIALVGDGSAMYTIQALWTAARESLAVVFVIFDNASYRILKQRVIALDGMSARHREFVGMDLDHPRIDAVGLARGFGVQGEQISRAAEVSAALQRGLASGGPYLIDALIDPAVI